MQVLVTRKRGSRASSVAPSQGGSFSSGQSFIAAQHSSDAEERVATNPGAVSAREDRSMTHEGILLQEAPQVRLVSRPKLCFGASCAYQGWWLSLLCLVLLVCRAPDRAMQQFIIGCAMACI